MALFAIVTGDFRLTGGMDRANYALAQFLADRGDEVHLVAHHVDDALADRPAVTFHRVPKPAGYLGSGPLLDHAGRRCAREVSRRGGRIVVNGGNCRWGDVNWVHYVHAAYRPESRAGRLKSLKTRIAHSAFLRDERLALPRASLVIANSDRTRDDLVRNLPVESSRIRTVYYGIDASRFGSISAIERSEARTYLGIPPERAVVAFIGALGDRRKGFDTLFSAWSHLCEQPGWDALLLTIGTGAEQPLWEARAQSSGMADRIRFMGYSREVPRLLAACDLLVHPTRYEAYGLGVHEAICRGLPALVSVDAGVAERYPEGLRHLLLPDPNDSADLAARLRVWHASRETNRAGFLEFSEALRARSWNDMAREMVEAIESTPPRQHA